MNYLQLALRLASILRSNSLRGDKAAYVACRTLCLQLQTRNPGLHLELGYALPVPTEDLPNL